MKKYLYLALALPMMFACSSDDLIEKGVVSNDQFPGIEKVDATFSMDENQGTRMDKGSWEPEQGDLWGFAWLGDGTIIDPTAAGIAYQNHNLIQTGNKFVPQTSIYVGSYFVYRPYDEETVSPQAINFKSLEEQTISEGFASSTQAWKDLAKTAINLGSKWTVVSTAGNYDGTTTWDKPGIKQSYKLYAAMFSNQTGLDMTYVNNDVAFDGTKTISGATDISFTPEDGTKVGAADIYSGTVELQDAGKSFTYAPKASPEDPTFYIDPDVNHNGEYWADKSGVSTYKVDNTNGFTITKGAITLNASDGIKTEGKTKGWIWFNSLPVQEGNGTTASTVQTILTTSYGVVTIDETVGGCAYVLDYYNAAATSKEWIKLAAADADDVSPKTWKLAGAHNTFINQYGNHKGSFAFDVDFSKGVMDGMHIINDTHLQKALKYYIASGKTETGATLLLDEDADHEFKISKISIALLQTIGGKVKVQACGTHGTPKIVVTQNDQTGDLADKKEVPALNNVFAAATDVYLSSACQWTWAGGDGDDPLPVDAGVNSITNEGTLTVTATNVALSTAAPLYNAAGATMNIEKVTTVMNALTNLGTINVGAADNTAAELRAYNVEIKNDATSLTAHGVINNYGVVGVSDIGSGKFNNYGLIDVKNAGAITLLSTNEHVSDFDNHFDAATNKMGTVNLPSPTALVSVANTDANGFIKYTWPADTKTYVTPEGNVKYNTIVVSGDIQFTEIEAEIKYIEFNGTRTQVINNGYLKNLLGVMVNAGKSIIIEKGNTLVPKNGTYLGAGATVYRGGTFTHNANPVSGTTVSNYFGDWQTTQIVKY